MLTIPVGVAESKPSAVTAPLTADAGLPGAAIITIPASAGSEGETKSLAVQGYKDEGGDEPPTPPPKRRDGESDDDDEVRWGWLACCVVNGSSP